MHYLGSKAQEIQKTITAKHTSSSWQRLEGFNVFVKDQLCPPRTCAMCIQLKGSNLFSMRSIALTKLSSFNYHSNFFHQDLNPLCIRSRLSQIHITALEYYEVEFNKSWKQRQTHLKRKLLIYQTIWKLEELHLCIHKTHTSSTFYRLSVHISSYPQGINIKAQA